MLPFRNLTLLSRTAAPSAWLQTGSGLRKGAASPSSPAFQRVNSTLRVAKSELHEHAVKLVIFDKDGTLISFDSTWSKWADDLIARCVARCGPRAHDAIADCLGYDAADGRVKGETSIMAWAAQPLIRAAVQRCVQEDLGFSESEAKDITNEVWMEADVDDTPVAVSRCTRTLFNSLRESGIKVGVCTSDARIPTDVHLARLGVDDLVDASVCGDDFVNVPKPAADNALNMCRQLGVSPSETVVVGDTNADLGMGKNARLGLSVGVLSGVGKTSDLRPKADIITENVDSLLDILPIHPSIKSKFAKVPESSRLCQAPKQKLLRLVQRVNSELSGILMLAFPSTAWLPSIS